MKANICNIQNDEELVTELGSCPVIHVSYHDKKENTWRAIGKERLGHNNHFLMVKKR